MFNKTFLPFMLSGAMLFAAPVYSDDIQDNLEDALEAYADGEIQETKEILKFVTTLLEAKSADTLASLLPKAPEGWTRTLVDNSEDAAVMAMFGGGATSEAAYTDGADENVIVRIMVDSPMVAMTGGQFNNPAVLAQMGDVKRINRQQVLLNKDGTLQSLIASRFLVQIEGSDDHDIHIKLFEAIDIKALKAF